MITELTPEQQAQIEVTKQRYIDMLCNEYPRSTDEQIMQAAEKCADAFKVRHDFMGLYPSSQRAQYAANAVKHGCKPEDTLGKSLDELKAMIGDNEVKALPVDMFGHLGQYWIGLYDYIVNVLNVECPADLKEQLDVSKSVLEAGLCGSVSVDYNVFMFRRPLFMLFDENDRLHCADGPAIEFEDGFKIYAIQGVRLNGYEYIITDPDRLNSDIAMKTDNVEIRRIMVEVMGLEKFLAGADTKVIDEVDEVGEDGIIRKARLLRLTVDGDRADIAVTEVVCPSTERVFYEEVPLEIATSYQRARQWAWGMPDITPLSNTIWER